MRFAGFWVFIYAITLIDNGQASIASVATLILALVMLVYEF